MNKTILFLLLFAGLALAGDFTTELYDYSRVFAGIGLLAAGGYSALKYMGTEDPLARKDALETFMYAVVGAVVVMMAPAVSQVLV